MRIIKKVLSQLYIYILWAFISVLVWGQVFSIITDTTPDKKITVFIESVSVESKAMSLVLEENMPEGIKFVKVRPFSYAMFYEETLLNADIYIVPESKAQEYITSFTGDGTLLEGGALDYIETLGERYYLFYGANSAHIEDGKAEIVGSRILNMR